ncbi:alpha/beta hydrolase [Arthrobacter sp. ISL-48]|uniref:alpha/beta hydrolase n=1 Tax=Arthrobacter sp. ISL-48 TaxID=2819110 RepID=UPI002035F707|nr:alpha/beta hydrolase fold domain-containing protein [Arthrobacter sp. ISL-48]
MHLIGPAHQPARGAIVWLHSGGMVSGAALSLDLPQVLDIAEDQSLLVVAVEYGRAPEHPAPAGMLNSLDALNWVAAHADELNYPRNALFLHGLSGGAGLAAAVAFEARAAGLDYAGLVIDGAMIDDRMISLSYQQLDSSSAAVAGMYRVMWNAVLGKESPSILADYPHLAVGRLVDEDFSGFPPVFLMCGASDAFRDDTTAMAQAIWRSGGTADLHQWAGTIHGSDLMVPEAHVSKESAAVRRGWYDRMMTRIEEDTKLSLDEKLQAI